MKEIKSKMDEEKSVVSDAAVMNAVNDAAVMNAVNDAVVMNATIVPDTTTNPITEKQPTEERTPEKTLEGEVTLALADLMAHAMQGEKRRIEPEMIVVTPAMEEPKNEVITNSVVVSLSTVAACAVLSLLLL